MSALQRTHLVLLYNCYGSEALDLGLLETYSLLGTCSDDDTRWEEDTRSEQHTLNTVL